MALVNREAEEMLEQWGIWSRTGRPGPGRYRSPAGVLQAIMVEQQGSLPDCMHEDWVMEDFDRRVMGAVKRSLPESYVILSDYYVHRYGMGIRPIAALRGMPRMRAFDALRTGIGAVAAAMALAA